MSTAKTTERLERCRHIARWTMPADTSEEEVERRAEELAAFAAAFPPLSREQLDKVRALLRPESWGPTVHTGERGSR